MPEYVVHGDPVLRGETNYIARIDLAPFGYPGQLEQVWLNREDGGLGALCCIPFQAYGVALRDVVRLSADGSTVVEIVRRSGRRTLRAFLAKGASDDRLRAEAKGFLSEWRGARYIAIDVPEGAEPAELLAYLESSECAGLLHWEWNDSLPFAV
jgi:hypothetical protein